MSAPRRSGVLGPLAAALATGLVALPVTALPAAADTNDGVVINEVYLKGGSANAPYANKFVELYNPAPTAVSLDGWSLQYRSKAGSGAANGLGSLSGTIPSESHFLISIKGNGDTGASLPAPDLDLGTAANPGGADGTLYLADTNTNLTLPVGDAKQADHVVDLIGYGSSNTFETAAAETKGGNAEPNSLIRTQAEDTDDNSADFRVSTQITPTNSKGQTDTGGGNDPEPNDPEPNEVTPIAEIQGTGDTSPMAGKVVKTTGVVTAAYPSGGYKGYYIQTPGAKPGKASNGLFVYSEATVSDVEVGENVEVYGRVSEYYGLTQITVKAGALRPASTDAEATVEPAKVAYPTTDAEREALEGMLIEPTGQYTVTDVYQTNQYGSVGLVAGTTPLKNPTAAGTVGSQEYKAAQAREKTGAVTLDDGAGIDLLKNPGNPVPYLSTTEPVRVGAPVTFTRPVILDYRNDAWKFQPRRPLTPDNAGTVQPVTIGNTRQAAPEKVGGDIRLAGFNVLNYFTDLGSDLTGCTSYKDRQGNGVTVSGGCDARGAWGSADLQRQQSKIVAAINGLGANVVSLEEIENSARFGHGRDASLANLVDALNSSDSLREGKWDYVRSPKLVPADEDVIRTAFIYKTDAVEPVGESTILDDKAFANARRPLAQAFRPLDVRARAAAQADDGTFLAIVNHFKSKGGDGAGDNADTGDGAGSFNGDRTRQAAALLTFAEAQEQAAGTDRVFMLGDFNAYQGEDPVQRILAAGFVSQGTKTGKETYAYDGGTGSLDHIFASPAADKLVTGTDVWNINSVESVALEYSRHNYNTVDLYADGPFRSSDHDPIIVGFNAQDAQTQPSEPEPGDSPDPSESADPSTPTGPTGGAGSGASGTGSGDGDGANGMRTGGTATGGTEGGATVPGTDEPGTEGTQDTASSGNGLARAGAEVVPWLVAGLATVLAGVGISVLARRRAARR